jgi:hypothetical protein
VAAQLQVVDRHLATACKWLPVMKLEKPALAATSLAADERALAVVTLPDFAPDARGNVPARARMLPLISRLRDGSSSQRSKRVARPVKYFLILNADFWPRVVRSNDFSNDGLEKCVARRDPTASGNSRKQKRARGSIRECPDIWQNGASGAKSHRR